MNDQSLINLLEHTAEKTPVGPPPIAEIARHARRRQKRLFLQAASSAVAALIVVTCLVALTRANDQATGPAHHGTKQAKHHTVGPNAVRLSGRWSVHALVAPNGSSALPRNDRDRMRLTFQNGRMTGTTTCNTIAGRYVQTGAKGQDLRFLPHSLTTTLVGCTGEPPLLATLRQVRHVSVAHGEHYLHAGNWMILVVLIPSSH